MTEEEKKAAALEEKKALIEKVKAETQATIEAAMKDYATSEEIEGLKTLVESKNNAEEIKALKTIVEGLETELKASKEAAENSADPMSPIRKQLIDQEETLKALPKTKGVLNLELKSFTQAGNFNPDFATFIQPDYVDGISKTPNTKENFNILNYISVGQAFSELIKWIEEDTETGTAQYIAECVSKPDVSKDWIRRQTEVKKLASYTRVCDEVLIYIGWAEQEIKAFMRKTVYEAMQEAIMNGDGTGENILGITPQATAFVAGAKALSVVDANFNDAIRAAVSQVNCLGHKADYVMMNCEDIFKLESTKDLNGNYLPQNLGGVLIVDCPYIPAGSFLVGDFKLSQFRIKQDITVEMGFNGEDFRENAISLRAEAFHAHYIPANHVTGFVYDTFAAVILAIDKV